MDKFEIFDNIKEFINDISECLNDIQYDKYQKLVELTDPELHESAFQKHIDVFKTFLTENQEAIESMDETKFNNKIIRYSDNVYMDIGVAFEKMKDEHKNIWNHLLVLSDTLVDNSKAMDVLVGMKAKSSGPVDMIFNLVDKVSQNINVNEDDNIDDVIKNVLDSGIVQDVYKEINTEIQNGNFDMSQMMGLVSGLLQGQGQGQGLNLKDILSSMNKN